MNVLILQPQSGTQFFLLHFKLAEKQKVMVLVVKQTYEHKQLQKSSETNLE